ncbi:MAG: NAD(P)/FAD-dependent oxidoreductase [Pseudomonadota bacterium]
MMDGDAPTLEAALQEADLRVLLMTVFHLSGDCRWLAAPYTPKRDVKLIADEDAGLPPEIADEIRAEAARLIRAAAPPAVEDPGDALMVEMMSACLGHPVGDEYATMMREEMGFSSRRLTRWAEPKRPFPHPVIVVGAGASGMILATQLRELNIDHVVLEEGDEVGGTWRVNRYPGCAVDTPNHAYSFSFGERNDWSRFFSPRDELFDYMVRRSHDFGVREAIRFNHRVTRCDWDEAEAAWRVTVETPQSEETLTASALVSAIGPLSDAKIAKIEGLDTFRGPAFHSTQWPEDFQAAGKSIAVIGTGASSLQMGPPFSREAASLTLYQRTPQWVREIPRLLDPMGAGARHLLQKIPFYAEWFRFTMLWRYGDGLLRTLRKDPDWPHPERSLNRINDRHRQEMTAHIEAELEGRPDLLAKCLPSYPPFGKRILLDNGWYRMLRRDNVELVTDPIARITPEGVQTRDGKTREADVLVLATGFDVTRFAARLNVTGRDGRRLSDEWADENPKAHLGITAPGFPNLFMLQGPATGLAHGGSAIFQAECQARYILGCLLAMQEQGLATLDVRREVHDAYMARVDAEHEQLVWSHPGMSTYYRNAHGRVVSVMPWRLVDYWKMTRAPELADFHAA